MYLKIFLLISFGNLVVGRDFVIGMFRKQDILVSQDIIYKEKFPYRDTIVKYGKKFDCPITYFRMADRLGFGEGPKVRVIRGGLHKKYIVAKIWNYNQPIAIIVQVGCQVPVTTTTAKPKENHSGEETDKSEEEGDDEDATKSDNEGSGEENTTEAEDGDDAPTEDTATEVDEGEGKANENESLRRKNLNTV